MAALAELLGYPTALEQMLGRPAWMADALCREYPSVSFFPARGENAAPAKAICARCAVREECMAFALDWPDPSGIEGVCGGTTPRDRQLMRATSRPMSLGDYCAGVTDGPASV